VAESAKLPKRLARGAPKGQQLREIIEALVESLEPGSALPSERELAERYGVARMTVRGEIDRLTQEGVTYRLHGRGTFVAEPRVAQAVALSSFTEDIRARGMVPSSRVRSQEVVEASALLARQLELPADSPVVRIDRVRYADGEPMAVEQAYLPATRFDDIADADWSSSSLFELLAVRYGVRLRDADQRVVAVAIEGDDARVLDVEEGDPGLSFATLARDVDGRPAYFAVSLFRGDRYEIELRQQRLEDGR
jgi:GntR family transcriptional regulator